MKIADEILCEISYRSHMSEIRIMKSYENYMRSHMRSLLVSITISYEISYNIFTPSLDGTFLLLPDEMCHVP